VGWIYRVPSRLRDRVQETPEIERRRSRDEVDEHGGKKELEDEDEEEEEDAEEAMTRRERELRENGSRRRHGPITKKQLTATHSRYLKDGKVEEHPLEPVRLLGACSELWPGEARERAFAMLLLARLSSLCVSRRTFECTTVRTVVNRKAH